MMMVIWRYGGFDLKQWVVVVVTTSYCSKDDDEACAISGKRTTSNSKLNRTGGYPF